MFFHPLLPKHPILRPCGSPLSLNGIFLQCSQIHQRKFRSFNNSNTIFSWRGGAYRNGKMGMLDVYWGRVCIIKLTQPPDNKGRKLEDTLIKKKIKFLSYIRRLRGIGCKVIYDQRPSHIGGKNLHISSYIRKPFLV